jgi:hypothetical protein
MGRIGGYPHQKKEASLLCLRMHGFINLTTYNLKVPLKSLIRLSISVRSTFPAAILTGKLAGLMG